MLLKDALLATPANMRRVEGQHGVIAYSLTTGEEYSATAGDYFMHADDQPLNDSAGEPMVLARPVTTFEPVTDEEAQR